MRKAYFSMVAVICAVGLFSVAAPGIAGTRPADSAADRVKSQKLVLPDSAEESLDPVTVDMLAISDWRDRHPDLLTNWAGMEREGDHVTMYWGHEVPKEFSEFMDLAKLASVNVQLSPYSYDEIGAEIRRLMSEYPEVTLWKGADKFVGIVAVVPMKAKDPVIKDSRMSVLIEHADRHWTNFLGRGNDVSAFYGGSQDFRLFGSGTPFLCSTGFPVQFSGGVIRMVTARHCGTNATYRSPESVYTSWPSSRREIGSTGGGYAETDSVLMAAASESSFGTRIYTGDWQATTSRSIVGTFPASIGEGICAGGAYSGQQCNNEVVEVNVHFNENGVDFGPGFVAANANGAQAGEGDSGSPAVKLMSGNTTLRVAGLLKGGDDINYPAPCTGWTANGLRKCSTLILYVDVAAVLARHSVSLYTGS
jgi:hypothetical protein